MAPFDLTNYGGPNQLSGDLVHRFYQEQYQIDGGKMDKFVAWSDAAGLVMSYYDATNMPEGKLAQQYTLMDNFFHGAFGGSFLNHQMLICACALTWSEAPSTIVAQLGPDGIMTKDGQVTPDGLVVNTSYTVNSPHPASVTDPSLLVPEQTAPTIGDRLNDAGVSWAWYSGGWDNALLGHPDPLCQFHHQPFAYYAKACKQDWYGRCRVYRNKRARERYWSTPDVRRAEIARSWKNKLPRRERPSNP